MGSFSVSLQSSSSAKAKCPGFFKFIVPLACTTRLRFPPSHDWNKEEAEYPEEVVLMDKKENSWSVKAKKVGNEVCFVDGWLTFVRDNNVKVDSFIVFENVGSNVYSFLIFDSNTKCETGGFNGFKYVNEEEDPMVEEDSEEFEQDSSQDSFHLRGNGNTTNRIGPKDRMPMKEISKRNPNRLIDIYAHHVFQSGVIPRPKNPYFVARLGRTNRDALFIPKNVIKDYNLYLQIKTIMRDNEGVEWETKLNEWDDGRRWYHGGWGSFCRKNHVCKGDYCVCEFIEEAGKGLILFVYKL